MEERKNVTSGNGGNSTRLDTSGDTKKKQVTSPFVSLVENTI